MPNMKPAHLKGTAANGRHTAKNMGVLPLKGKSKLES